MYCRNCGKQINDSAAFCPFCGQKNTVKPPQMQEPPQIQTPTVVSAPAVIEETAPVSETTPAQERKSGGNALPIILLAALFVIGMLAEILVNTPIQQLMYNPFNMPWSEIRRTVTLQTIQSIGHETIPIYAVPSFLMNLMMYSARSRYGAILRWFPYLVLFFVPVLSAIVRKKGIPLLISGIFTLFEGIGVLITSVSQFGGRYLNVMNGIPFVLEAVIVILLAVSFFAKNKPLCLIAGILSALFAVFSIFLTPALRLMNAAMQSADTFIRAYRMVLTRPRILYANASGSFWPVYKTFVLLMYAVLSFLSVKRMGKK